MSNAPLFLPDSEAMEAFGARLAACTAGGEAIYLHGDLGAGKTTLVRGFMRALGHSGAVKSPTYTIVEPYELGARRAYHFDLYRLGEPEELEYMGTRHRNGSICLNRCWWSGRSAARVSCLSPISISLSIMSKAVAISACGGIVQRGLCSLSALEGVVGRKLSVVSRKSLDSRLVQILDFSVISFKVRSISYKL